MELTLQGKSLVLLKKYIKLQLDFIFIKLNLQPKKGFLKAYLNCSIVKFEDYVRKKRFFTA
jgi:hypothetical protein